MFDSYYVYDLVARLEREELDRKVERISRYNLNPPPANSHRRRYPGRLSPIMIFFRNVVMK